MVVQAALMATREHTSLATPNGLLAQTQSHGGANKQRGRGRAKSGDVLNRGVRNREAHQGVHNKELCSRGRATREPASESAQWDEFEEVGNSEGRRATRGTP